MTIAASGQGRWQEDLDFPEDCRASGYKPVLIVLDPTLNPKLAILQDAFADAGGESYAGQAAWSHLESMAGETMATFLSKYVHRPIQALLAAAPANLPDISFSMQRGQLIINVSGERMIVERRPSEALAGHADELPEDVFGDVTGG